MEVVVVIVFFDEGGNIEDVYLKGRGLGIKKLVFFNVEVFDIFWIEFIFNYLINFCIGVKVIDGYCINVVEYVGDFLLRKW